KVIVSESNDINVPLGITNVKVGDARKALAKFSKRFYGSPDHALNLIGITGTNGKTTVSTLTRHLLEGPGKPVGLIGTVSYNLGDRDIPSYKTTPEATDLYPMLKSMLAAGCSEAVMEVSSHGIHQSRVSGLNLEVAVFMNLTRDHLDYHGTMEDYYREKRKLFNGVNGPLPKVAVINGDCPYGRRLAEELPPQVHILTFGFNENNQFRAKNLSLDAEGSKFVLESPLGNNVVASPLIGRYNVINALASFAIVHAMGKNVSKSIHKLRTFEGVSGRMESLEKGQPYRVVVDYAHTPDALRNALEMLRECTKGKVRVVFGCGGDRDKGKRLEMTRVACAAADQVWATSDNPRTEGIDSIFADMRKGVCKGADVYFVEDRRRAIDLALDAANNDDCVLIAGKGHETYQEVQYTAIPFDDRIVASDLLSAKLYGG
ncbi:MAG: UDP-N-acetylmuramoyl-L-alanyl-D-glutamate--2,6-diaminopimelate ligase, partial [Opitutae bacterium]|nr:UDP-N-acetylmuramoyl-L-alanyl-D-glutamate--2,6-diaminopimelate ligase [Opitutae bacterium]